MKYFILFIICLPIFYSCEKSEEKGKKTVAHKNSPKKKTTKKSSKNSANTKILIVKFTEYSEGDLIHLVFTEVSTGDKYEFNEFDESKFGGIQIRLPDDNSSFGYRENPEYINRKFKIKIVFKSILTSDPITGETIKVKDWSLENLQLLD